MQNETYVNKKLLRYFENTNRQIVEYAGFISFRIRFLISVLILVVVGNVLLLFLAAPTTSVSPLSTKATPISFDTGRATATPGGNHLSSLQSGPPISLPGLQPTHSAKLLPKGEKTEDAC